MDKILDLMRKNWFYLAGGIVGATGGFLYWRFVGCSTGTCPITSSPIMSTIYGAVMGGLLFSMIFTNKKNKI
jgi:glycerol uptake facilitator-like aquaporin